jgi:cobalamin biosynthesis protein CobT
MANALMHAGVSVLSRKNKRKIVFAMTDGDPDNYPTTINTISLLEKEGVELYGIGINHQISHLFKRSAFISNLSELRTELFKVAQGALINN